MNIKDKTVLITGANRGLGKALVEEALKRGAKRVYAASRTPITHADQRAVSLTVDITNADQIQEAAKKVESLDILINNAGVALYGDLNDRKLIEQHFAVNLFGMQDMAQAFLPLLERTKGAVVSVLSTTALVAFPPIAAYSISKAAAFSLMQSMRALWAERGVKVYAVLPGPIDTDMSRGIDIPKTAPEVIAQAIFDSVEKGELDIFPDPASAPLAEGWRGLNQLDPASAASN